MKDKIQLLNWDDIAHELNTRGYAAIPSLLSPEQCEALRALYHKKTGYRKTVIMERHRFGLGEYKYFDYPLPPLIQALRTNIYKHLAPIANLWMKALNTGITYPATHTEFLEICKAHEQTKPTVLILKYGEGGFNTLHQDLYGEVYFPIQMVMFLSHYGHDYEGGEFVMTEQVPKAQSKAIVLKPKLGDVVLFATNFRPVKGKNGYYRANMRHGVSELTKGSRMTAGIIFHDALS
ncbi:2OG-Fe(II) oxygenase [Fulvivirga lutimaris]|uniref:2OG-Fe(II) oxygenase n=1 Tax=Fulvivirga lutimaris TaxID=1819566 RepID=UPI0012BC4A03|nr:2OG-Fe(II) oxygenase [Fulvivirga lutimaris]MTI39442.1 prolyl 4-hydroxylase subunit alpha [Fulvivirga lutimaris]